MSGNQDTNEQMTLSAAFRKPDTSEEALEKIRESGKDETARKEIAFLIAEEPRTLDELYEASKYSQNTVRPRTDELLRMGCITKNGTDTNSNGNKVYIYHITTLGIEFLKGEVDPEPEPNLTSKKNDCIEIAREFLRGEVPKENLQQALRDHDQMKRRLDPKWNKGLKR